MTTESKNCKKGYSCGASCINLQYECTEELQENSKALIEKYFSVTDKKVLAAFGGDVDKENITFDTIADKDPNFKALNDIVSEGKLSNEVFESINTLFASLVNKPKPDRTGVKTPTLDSVEEFMENGGIDKYEQAFNASFSEGIFRPELPGGIKDYIDNEVIKVEVPDDVAQAVYKVLPKTVKDKLKKAGDPRGGFWQGTFKEDGTPVIGKTAKDVRGVQLVKRYLEQKGIDPYDKKLVDLNDAELEHIVPEGLGTDNADQPNNFAWISASNNKWHSDLNPDEWRANGNKKLSDKQKYVEDYQKAIEEANVSAKNIKGASSAIGNAFSKASPQERVNEIRKIAETMGPKAKKLLSSSGIPESFQELRIDKYELNGQKKNRTQSVDTRVGVLLPFFEDKFGKQKPSSLIMQAMAHVADDPEKLEGLKSELTKVMNDRKLDFDEGIKIYEDAGRDKEAFTSALKEKDESFAKNLRNLFDSLEGFYQAKPEG